jgi:adhesin/invasin
MADRPDAAWRGRDRPIASFVERYTVFLKSRMHPSFASRCAVSIAAAILFAAACSESSSEPKSRPPAALEVLAGEDQSGMAGAQLPSPIIVVVLDDQGLPVPDQPVTFQVVAGGGSVDAASARTNAAGLAQVRWTLGTAMNTEQRLVARAGSGNGPSVEIFASVGPAEPARLEVVPPTPGGNVYPGARVLDRFGNPVPGVTVEFTVIAGGGTVEGATQTSNALGIATVGRWNLGAPGANTLRMSSGTLTPVTYTIMQRSLVPARVILSAGQGQTANVGSNVPFPLSVIVQNDAGDALSDIAVTFTPGANSGNVATTTVNTGANGMATLVCWTLGPVVGEQTLVAAASPTATFTFTATATPERVGRLEKFAGDAQTALVGQPVTTAPSVKVLDVYGNAVPGVPVTFTVYNGLGTVTGGNAVSNAAGIATVGSWTLGPFAGTQTLRASAPTTSASDVDFTATATTGLAAAINAHPDNPTSALLRTEITLSVIVVDDMGNPKAGIPISFATVTSPYFGQGTVLEPSQNVLTNAQGVASVRYTMPEYLQGAAGVLASGSGLPTLQVNVTPVTGPASQILVTLPNTAVVAGGDLGQPTFSVVDAYGNAIPFYSVTFTVTTGGGTVDGVVEQMMMTTPSPTTIGPMWRSGPVAGVNTIVLAAENVPSVVVTRTTISPP